MVRLYTFKTASACGDDNREEDTDVPIIANRFRVIAASSSSPS
jgi:hypothetical protein